MILRIYLLNALLLCFLSEIYSQSSLDLDTIQVIATLPTIEVKANSEEEILTINLLANQSKIEYSYILYVDRILDYIQNEYHIPSPLMWAIIWLSHENPSSQLISLQIPDLIGIIKNKKIDPPMNQNYKDINKKNQSYSELNSFIWSTIESLAQDININNNCKTCEINDYHCWIKEFISIENKTSKSITTSLINQKKWSAEIQNTIEKYKLLVLIR